MTVALTTVNNPYDPFTQFDQWYYYDEVVLGLHSSAYLARVARTSDEFTDEETEAEIEAAIDEIIKFDPLNIYKKVKRGTVATK